MTGCTPNTTQLRGVKEVVKSWMLSLADDELMLREIKYTVRDLGKLEANLGCLVFASKLGTLAA
jgi:hypothetical protein